MTNFTQLLSALGQDDRHAASRLLPLVYYELRRLAAQRMAQEQPGQALQPTRWRIRAWCAGGGTGIIGGEGP
jgi:ECF sigma factor